MSFVENAGVALRDPVDEDRTAEGAIARVHALDLVAFDRAFFFER